jgi:hypothetical protein
MPGLSKRAQELLKPVKSQVVLRPKNQGIPQSFRTTKG